MDSSFFKSETQTTSFKVFTRVGDSISYDDNHYAKGASPKAFDVELPYLVCIFIEPRGICLNKIILMKNESLTERESL